MDNTSLFNDTIYLQITTDGMEVHAMNISGTVTNYNSTKEKEKEKEKETEEKEGEKEKETEEKEGEKEEKKGGWLFGGGRRRRRRSVSDIAGDFQDGEVSTSLPASRSISRQQSQQRNAPKEFNLTGIYDIEMSFKTYTHSPFTPRGTNNYICIKCSIVVVPAECDATGT